MATPLRGFPEQPLLAENVGFEATVNPSFRRWLHAALATAPVTSSMDGADLPFQRWFRFKEAFSPRFVADAIASLPKRPRTCLDPFGGSGTTALTCQFFGIEPTTIEVNPFLADLIDAKLATYDIGALSRDYDTVCRYVLSASACSPSVDLASQFLNAPPTLIEPGKGGRWIFDQDIAVRILTYLDGINRLRLAKHRRLFQVLLGAILIGVSNVTISGKGRRYRKPSAQHACIPEDVDIRFASAFHDALEDIALHAERLCRSYTVRRGDARKLVATVAPVDVVICSPPYPNSFDYTDIYNVELWMLGYLRKAQENRALREATLRSHVQIKRDFSAPSISSPTLARILTALQEVGPELWDVAIPRMVHAYFDDISAMLGVLRTKLSRSGRILMVVGDSRYAGVLVDVASVLCEIVPTLGLRVVSTASVRNMRSSIQQGGNHDLSETLIHLALAS